MAVDHRKGGPKRVREEETRAAHSSSDREPLGRRLKTLETHWGLAGTKDAKIKNNRQGFATRVADIESAS